MVTILNVVPTLKTKMYFMSMYSYYRIYCYLHHNFRIKKKASRRIEGTSKDT